MGFGLEEELDCAIAQENAVAAFKEGTHEVSPDLNWDVLPKDLEDNSGDPSNNELFCRIVRDSDRGDSSVGIPGWDAWVLDHNQDGTLLQKLIQSHKQLKVIKDLLDNRSSLSSSDDYWEFLNEIESVLEKK